MKRLAFLMSFSLFTTSAAYAKSFQSVDGKKVEIKSTSRIVALNSTTFEIINALDNAGIEAKVNSGAIQTSTTWIDFDDPQMLATPQLGTITPA